MFRTQIQLRESQVRALKDMASRYHVSMAELIRRSVDQLLKNTLFMEPDKLRQKAINVAGQFQSGHKDISVNHDKYLNEDFSQ